MQGLGQHSGFQLCSRFPGVLVSAVFLSGLALLICEMRTTSRQTSQFSLSQSCRQY